MSIVFDRAAGYYDETRALPPEIADKPAESLVREGGLEPGDRVLELGIGTGRIALGVAARIGRVTGIDLSLEMMRVLQVKLAGGPGEIDLTQADVLRLPFPDDTFDAIYAVHVLHLVKGWQGAVAEARRALKPGGRMLVSWHTRKPHSPNRLLREELHRLVGLRGVSTRRPGAQTEEEIMAELGKWGHAPRAVTVYQWTEPSTPGEIIDELDRQIFSETWMIPRKVLDEVMPDLRAWAERRFGSLDRTLDAPADLRWLIAVKS